ncbi:anthranilate synthase component I family protein [Peribacillus sp. SCS-155]|uniref:anthranilate synthase component I family protein n=1 Tax=Peribacillus sedimenti TaxID=3115297 RepID=UPI003905B297
MNQRRVKATNIPYTAEDFFASYRVLSQFLSSHAILESRRGGRYSIAGLNPVARLVGKDHKLTIQYNSGKKEELSGNPLHLMKKWMAKRTLIQEEGLPDFQGGALGFLSYDYIRYVEKIPVIAKDDLQTPEIFFLIFDEVYVYDHTKGKLWFIYAGDEQCSEEKLSEMQKAWNSPSIYVHNQSNSPSTASSDLKVSLTEEEFKQAVEKIRRYIAQGDIFQVNLSVRQSQELQVPPIRVYEVLRKLNPSPYMAYLKTDDFEIVSGSPELLVKKKKEQISTRPIAGTRSRGNTPEEDDMLAKELIENEKERAEHVMLVDLERNDLGRVCRYGSVEVNEFMAIEKYSHVMHIVSNVRGILADNKDGYDVIDAVFPGGTITGAPKVRTMEIIEELEPVRRGIYTGSIGWIGYSGDLELNIVIRTMLAQNGIAHIQAGAGVVIDSNPKYEYKESLKKAFALWKAKEKAEKGGVNDDSHD